MLHVCCFVGRPTEAAPVVLSHFPFHVVVPMSSLFGGPPIPGVFICKECYQCATGRIIDTSLAQVFSTPRGDMVFSRMR